MQLDQFDQNQLLTESLEYHSIVEKNLEIHKRIQELQEELLTLRSRAQELKDKEETLRRCITNTSLSEFKRKLIEELDLKQHFNKDQIDTLYPMTWDLRGHNTSSNKLGDIFKFVDDFTIIYQELLETT